MAKRTALTADEIDELKDMLISTTCGERKELAHLAELGLCRYWKGRWGWVATITPEGKAFMDSKGLTEEKLMPARLARVAAHPSPSPSPRVAEPAPVSPAPKARAPVRTSRVAAPSAQANSKKAVRVTLKGRCIYYPVSMFDTLHYDHKEIVETGNVFYRSVPVAAAAGDKRVRSKRS